LSVVTHTASAVRMTVGEIAAAVGGQAIGPTDRAIDGLDAVRDATATQLTFIADGASAKAWREQSSSEKGAMTALVSRAIIDDGTVSAEPDSRGRTLVVVDDAEQAMIDLLERFAPPVPVPAEGVHPSAVVDPSATLGPGCRIGAHATIGARCRIGAGVTLQPGVQIYDDVVIGDGTMVHANCVVRERCSLGRGVILHPGVMIGADGFGYRPAPDGRGLRKVPQIGTVIIEDAVEIGSGTCVDRGKFGATRIGAGTKIDNLCQIAHNCRIGRSCVMAGCAGLAGSVELGDGVMIGGGTCVTDHRTVGAGARIGGMSGVHTDVPAGASYIGTPAGDAGAVLRQYAALRRLPDWIREAKRLARGT